MSEIIVYIEKGDLAELDKFLNKEPLLDCHDKYRLVLSSISSLRRSGRITRKSMSNQPKRFNFRASTRNKTRIQYETPEKNENSSSDSSTSENDEEEKKSG